MRFASVLLFLVACDPFGAAATPGPPADGAVRTDAGPDADGLDVEWSGAREGWKISNRDGASTTDCCDACPPGPCAIAAAAGCDNTALRPIDNVTLQFSSGPKRGARQNRRDGFYAVRAFRLAPGKAYRLEVEWARLDARLDGDFGGERFQHPTWFVAVREEGKPLARIEGAWGDNACRTCTVASGPELGPHTSGELTATTGAVEVVVSAFHTSTQCGGEAYEVQIDAKRIRFVEVP